MSRDSYEVNLQILLAVGLAVIFYCLVLGCIFCCRRQKTVSPEDKEAALLPPHLAAGVAVGLSHSPRAQRVQQQYEELDGDVLEFVASSSPSEDDLSDPSGATGPRRSADLAQAPRLLLPLRRLSSPAVPCSPRKTHGRASLPSLSKISFVSKSRLMMGRRSTGNCDNLAHFESSRLCAPKTFRQQGEPSSTQYGSGSLSISKSAPLLHFSLLFSSTNGTLMLKILGLSGHSRRWSGVIVRVSLPPIYPSPQQMTLRRRSLSPDLQGQSCVLQVGSVEELHTCILRIAVYSRDFSGLREASLGWLELPCEPVDWESETTNTYTKQLTTTRGKLKKSVSSQESLGRRKSLVGAAVTLGKVLILLQYQASAQRIKVMVRKAENLTKLTRIPGAPDHCVVIKLHQEGKVISTKETKGVSGPNPVWNAPFLFDLPTGDITQLPITLEFVIMQGRLYTKSSVLGRVLIGSSASEVGQGHWREMCRLQQTETTRWHTIQSEAG
ncbi:hypothetical protein OJAV_G00026050 [Oryzias javanicus]|uniref:C2 domain-containing protein n=1 Tax=Oryzias javanicus TaxID=123683 RepID=A0A3S2MFP9_ORYJA|nr:hypothetical protein OJAV_G00026050 [Oryzias javanicus]